MDTPITRAEHEEFRRRINEHFERNDKRIAELEDTVRQINELTLSVQSLAQSVKSMAESQNRQEGRLDELENRDGEMWRKVTGYIATAVVGIVIGFIFKQIGM